MVNIRLVLFAPLFSVISMAVVGEEAKTLREAGAAVQLTVVVDRTTFSFPSAKKRMLEMAESLRHRSRFIIVAMLTDPAEARAFVGGRRQECRSYAEYLSLRRDTGGRHGPMARLVTDGEGSLIEYRGPDGKQTSEILAGRDPSRIQVGNSTFQILHLYFAPPAPLLRDQPSGNRRIGVYLRTEDDLNPQLCAEAMREMARRFECRLLTAEFRNDALFPYDAEYPLIHPLYDPPTLPSEDVFGATRTISCSNWLGSAGCSWSLPNSQ